MVEIERAFVVGGDESWGPALEEQVGLPVEAGIPAEVRRGDVYLLDAATPRGAEVVPAGNAFSQCRDLKRDPSVLVFLAIREGDAYGAEIARFCLADGVVFVAGDGALDLSRIAERLAPRRGRTGVDELLGQIEGRVGAGSAEQFGSALQKSLAAAEAPGAVARWTDAETGLFDGPFAGFKLDEEFKRARRFHQPLSLVLLDAGVAAWPEDDEARRTVLAEIASIFLNECRDIDVLARFTPDVFMFLFPGTGPDGARIAVERIVASLRERSFSVPLEVRPAAGIATVPLAGVRDRRSFLALAEAALEAARKAQDEPVQVAGI
jgi:diguanylate cyclase (GGDEF)-like protein